MKLLRTASVAACVLFTQANLLAAKDTQPAGGEKKEAKPAAAATDEQPDLDFNRIGDALKALSTAKDEEALQLMADAGKNDGKMSITGEQATALIKKAIDKGLIPAKAGSAKAESDPVLAAKVLGPLADKGDAFAKELVEKAKTNGGKLELSKEEIARILTSAKEQGLLPKASGADVGKAIQALANNGDETAKAKLAEAKDKGGKLELTPAEAEKFVETAKAKGLLK